MQNPGSPLTNPHPIPLWLLIEITYRCPLQCPYCSNPIEFARYKNELSTEEWFKVLKQARELGAAQLGFSGGEPLVRQDLELLIAEARRLGFYTNLITSSLGMTEQRLIKLKEAGIDSIQISIQASNQELSDFIAGTTSFQHKLNICKKIKELGFPLSLNFVLHKLNIDDIASILELAVALEADYVELANTQYYGFALHNRDQLLPTKAQVNRAEDIAHQYQERYQGKMKIYYVIPDYYENRPKPCMSGWGKVFLTITPDGVALPCHSARDIPNLSFPNVRDVDLKWIWEESPLFNHFRGFDWMKEPCRSCPERFKDFGGCRCQALKLTGDAAMADPVCSLSPHHQVVLDAIDNAAKAKPQPLLFRNIKISKKLSE